MSRCPTGSGRARGGGLELALACDMRVATSDSRFPAHLRSEAAAATEHRMGERPDENVVLVREDAVGFVEALKEGAGKDI